MRIQRKIYAAGFKAKVAQAALKGDRTINQLAGQYDVHPTQIHAWKKQLLDGAEAIFANGAKRASADAEAARDLTQTDFARLLEKDLLLAADPQKGRLRSFLKADCTYFLADQRDRERAQKRGGLRAMIHIEAFDAVEEGVPAKIDGASSGSHPTLSMYFTGRIRSRRGHRLVPGPSFPYPSAAWSQSCPRAHPGGSEEPRITPGVPDQPGGRETRALVSPRRPIRASTK
jgi:transposase-like protein